MVKLKFNLEEENNLAADYSFCFIPILNKTWICFHWLLKRIKGSKLKFPSGPIRDISTDGKDDDLLKVMTFEFHGSVIKSPFWKSAKTRWDLFAPVNDGVIVMGGSEGNAV